MLLRPFVKRDYILWYTKDFVSMEEAMPAKISRPTLSGAVQRERLFKRLDYRAEKPVTWVSAPGGSGKSTLVASYLDARELPCIWYHCDEGDADLATFFYYMGLAAEKASSQHKNPLPLLTAEYLTGISTFTRRYFEQLYDRVTTIVLDNYQDIPADAPFHDMLSTGLNGISGGIRVIVLSRGKPPAALARLQANGKIDQLQSSDIHFTLDETTELILGRLPKLHIESIKVIHEKTEGWAAGIILMLERKVIDATSNEPARDFAYDGVFDYFAGEIFNRNEKEMQDFLIKTAFLPMISVPQAEMLSGVDYSARILSTLNRHHLFTERLSGNAQNYQYHPLFRAFLLNRAKRTFTTNELVEIQLKAAQLLEQSGQVKDAARLYCEAGDRNGLTRMVIRHARELLMQGRNRIVEEWIACIPDEQAEYDPWLWYWRGMCSFPVDMALTRSYLEKGFESFKTNSDASGLYLAWAGIVDSYAFGDNWKNLDGCIAVFEELTRDFPSFPSQEIELIAASRMLFALTLRKTDQPQRVQGWLERVSALLQQNPSFDIQMDTVFCMSVYYLWKGEYARNAVLLERAEAEIQHRQPSPFAVIRIKLMRGIHYWVSADYQAALQILGEALETSTRSGVHVYDSLLWCFKGAAEMAPGNLELAEKSLKNQMSSLLGMKNSLNTFFYHINSAWYALLKGNPTSAAEHLETISASTESLGTPYYQALWNIGMAQAVFQQGHAQEAYTHVQAAHRISLNMKSHVMEWYSQLVEAYFLLQEGTKEEGLLLLRHGLSLGRRYGYVHLEFYQPDVMCYLFAVALAKGIEQAYVIGLIRKLGLAPPATSECYLEEWPYPIKICTLGRFEIFRDDQPLIFSGKEQKKPLDLLKTLISYGARNVAGDRLTDALWPDADGDQAHKSLETTLSRLRKLFGGEEYIIYRARQLTINPLYCWVDTLALECLFDTIQEAPPDQVLPLCDKAIALYKGPFLPAETGLNWAVYRREAQMSRLLRVIGTAGRYCEQAGEWALAARYYAKGIEVDNLAEEFYRCLMICHLNLGNHAAVAKTYNSCCNQLQIKLGIEPSPDTTSVYSSIVQKL